MVADPGILRSESRGASEDRAHALLSAARRRAAFTGLLTREAEEARPAARPLSLQEYAAFVLEQEAEYCQQ